MLMNIKTSNIEPCDRYLEIKPVSCDGDRQQLLSWLLQEVVPVVLAEIQTERVSDLKEKMDKSSWSISSNMAASDHCPVAR